MPSPFASQVKWNADGLVPAVVQDARDGRVLMLAWMNAESLALTLQTGYTHFWSRSRRELWKKGATSGNLQRVTELRLDCDGDTIVAKVEQDGPACHTGSPTCFFWVADGAGALREAPEAAPLGGVLDRVYQVIEARRAAADPSASYVARLFAKGRDGILKKIAEEAGEVLLAAKGGDPDAVTREVADLLFHTLVAMADAGVRPDDVAAELARRFGTSGIDEKANRQKG
ncbi:MAG: bifunctional phosphoribosyl-AMP cyclohydrolase/phosphoribosyl-ATP diphosphatase HisIE [Nitrospirae bacterium]|nr:bifunctional phosphoribosyl-AMP cyclohydrolase/phosphoribosyl-ATP diphosphatase HisIE [Nitrospirota bacterium]